MTALPADARSKESIRLAANGDKAPWGSKSVGRRGGVVTTMFEPTQHFAGRRLTLPMIEAVGGVPVGQGSSMPGLPRPSKKRTGPFVSGRRFWLFTAENPRNFPIYPDSRKMWKIFRGISLRTRRSWSMMRPIGANMPRLHGFHRFLPRLWELFYCASGSPTHPARTHTSGTVAVLSS
jgi:hypothetical protein